MTLYDPLHTGQGPGEIKCDREDRGYQLLVNLTLLTALHTGQGPGEIQCDREDRGYQLLVNLTLLTALHTGPGPGERYNMTGRTEVAQKRTAKK